MAYSQSMSPQTLNTNPLNGHNHHYRDVNTAATAASSSSSSSPSQTQAQVQQTQLAQQAAQQAQQTALLAAQHLRQLEKQRFVAELSQCLFDFVIQLLPTQEELAVKEDVRKLLERLIRTIEPDSRLLSFGSTANGFSLRNSDMDLCCLIDSEERLAASNLVTMLGDLLERETKFHVKPLPHARIPIVKLSLDPSPGLPLGIACDIGFENRLALENTRLLMCYAMIDPTRVRTMVLFLKVWSKRRKINSPYKGTLSSYGYVLLVIYFLVHVKNPPVLPNLQQMPPLRPISKEETHLAGYNTWFFDDIELLRQRWHSENTETVAELLIDFFRYFSRDFLYNIGVASIRAGLLKKDTKGWQNDLSAGRYNDARERNRLCIEDPFETDYNVARCVTKDGLYTIRGEFMRASRVLATRPERAILALADLCDERKEEDLVTAPPYVPVRQQFPPQTPYTVGSRPMRSKGTPAIPSPIIKLHEPGPQQVPIRPPPEHMAPKRSQWTSPPPPEAPSSDHTLFESQLGIGLELATAATEAREKQEASYISSSSSSSSNNSEILDEYDEARSDAAESDDVTSIRSFTEGTGTTVAHFGQASAGPSFRRPSWLVQGSPNMRLAQAQIDLMNEPPSRFMSAPKSSHEHGHRPEFQTNRFNRFDTSEPGPSPVSMVEPPLTKSGSSSISLSMKRSSSGPPRRIPKGHGHSPLAVSIPLPPSPDISTPSNHEEPATVFYQTRSPHSHSTFLYPVPHSPLSPYHTPSPTHTQQQHRYYNGPVPHDIFPSNLPSLSPTEINANVGSVVDVPSGLSSSASSTGQMTPTPTSVASHNNTYSHSHSASTTIPSPSPITGPSNGNYKTNDNENDRSVIHSPPVTPTPTQLQSELDTHTQARPQPQPNPHPLSPPLRSHNSIPSPTLPTSAPQPISILSDRARSLRKPKAANLRPGKPVITMPAKSINGIGSGTAAATTTATGSHTGRASSPGSHKGSSLHPASSSHNTNHTQESSGAASVSSRSPKLPSPGSSLPLPMLPMSPVSNAKADADLEPMLATNNGGSGPLGDVPGIRGIGDGVDDRQDQR
ncbi:hypothetical protein BDP27DRAFT_1416053 [Rhodocollybia butyracea]|uniref:polynucleotide adenylyltransferase n=1 Tax=Rhodocollybia butyracea TaxID=206335 RepID=A0A9P5Q5E0_9AGAR|nr:hypothetical protein BDP27DRAFT_1416053 [Rhodocollybia butyracea]